MYRIRFLLPVLALMFAASVLPLQSALADEGADTANATLYGYPSNATTTCASGGITNGNIQGFVNFNRVGDVVSFNVHLQGAQPNATYLIALACVNYVGEITTNSNGVGNRSFQQSVSPAENVFFVDIYNLTTQPMYLASSLVTLN